MIYRARTVLTTPDCFISNGAVVVKEGRIVDLGRFEEVRARHHDKVIDLGAVVLLPGLINGHCHLDFTLLRGAIPPPSSFADWIRQINAKRREIPKAGLLKSIIDGFEEAAKWGTTTIANIESFPSLLPELVSPPIRTWWFYELIDVQSPSAPEEMVEKALSLAKNIAKWPGGFGLSPHAPYTASPRLSRTADKSSELLTMHVAESAEEMEMFLEGKGPLYELLQRLGRPMKDCAHGKTPLATVLDRHPLDDRWIIVHLNELTKEDFRRLETSPRFHIAHCPRSSRYFGHRPFELEQLRNLGFNICLGTDSLASNDSLSMFAEMRAVRDAHSSLAPSQILQMATINGARALHQQNSLGRISLGFLADLIALPVSDDGELLEQIIDWNEAVPWTLRSGLDEIPNR